MFEQILSKNTKQALDLLIKSGLLHNVYLAGGTGLALQIGHRYSDDLDFFSPQEFQEEILIQKMTQFLPRFKLERKEWKSVLAYVGNTRFSLLFYQYPLLFRPRQFLGLKIADIKDIAPMKISAIISRGTKRDFIDLYFICAKEKILSLEQAIKFYDQKFKAFEVNKLHLFKSIVYFEDADQDVLPKMIQPVDWLAVKDFFTKEQKRLAKKLFGL